MISVSDFRARSSVVVDDDTVLEKAIASAIATWETATKRLWARRVDHVERVEPESERISTIILELQPVESVSLVEERFGGPNTAFVALDSATAYELEGARKVRRYGGWFAPHVRITYTGGYVEPGAPEGAVTPEDIQEAILTQAAYAIERRSDGKLVVQSQNFEGGGGVFLPADYHPVFRTAVTAYRRKA